MPNKKSDETLQEILEEDNTTVRKSKRKNGIARLLLILTILVVFFFGFLYVTQYLADMEAEARVRAILTASANPAGYDNTIVEATDIATLEAAPTETAEIVTATVDPDLERTATIAAQLTSVAEFQSTETPAE
jgi:ATP-dependent Zn protease